MPECNLPIAIEPNALRLLVLAHPSSKLITLIKEHLNLKSFNTIISNIVVVIHVCVALLAMRAVLFLKYLSIVNIFK